MLSRPPLFFSASNYCCTNSIRETISCAIGQLAWGWGCSSTFITNTKPSWKQECTLSSLEKPNIWDPWFTFLSLSYVLYFYPLCSLHHPGFLFSLRPASLPVICPSCMGSLYFTLSLGPRLCLRCHCPDLISMVSSIHEVTEMSQFQPLSHTHTPINSFIR